MVSRSRPRDGVSRVAPILVVCVPSSLPRWSCWVLIAPFPSSGSFPCEVVRSASTLLFSRPAQRLLTLQPAHSGSHLMTLSIGGFSRLVTFPTAPIATGRSDPCREGLAPSQELCLSTAHVSSALSPVTSSFLPPSRRGLNGASNPGWAECTSARLSISNGCQDHTTSPYASMPFVLHASLDRSRV